MTVITTAFETAARVRAGILGMGGLSIVPMPHPLASKTAAEVNAIADSIVESIVQGLVAAKA